MSSGSRTFDPTFLVVKKSAGADLRRYLSTPERLLTEVELLFLGPISERRTDAQLVQWSTAGAHLLDPVAVQMKYAADLLRDLGPDVRIF